jgi:hypothetical protein
LSSEGTNLTLQTNFVTTELQTARRMLDWAVARRSHHEHEGAMESLGLARVALSGAEQHMSIVKLPADRVASIKREARELWHRIQSLEIPAA